MQFLRQKFHFCTPVYHVPLNHYQKIFVVFVPFVVKKIMSHLEYFSALQDFRRARRRANLEQIAAFLKGTSTSLLSFDDVRHKLRAAGAKKQGLQEIPLDAIVGSVSRYEDFTRSFLPKRESEKERWAAIEVIATGAEGGLPPIEVYQIGEVYFVYDGNHRVSAARQVGAKVIEAYITELHTDIPITPDIQPDELILKAEQIAFFSRTQLNRLRSLKDFGLTLPGKYHILEEQITLYQHIQQEQQQRRPPHQTNEFPSQEGNSAASPLKNLPLKAPCPSREGNSASYDEAVKGWYDTMYLPVVQIIEDLGILRDFPNRTVTDFYVWLAEHRSFARQIETLHDDVYVSEIWENVPDSPEFQTDEQIIEAEYHDFLKHTQIHRLRPGAHIQVSIPGKYRLLEEHITVHRYFMGIEQKREIPYTEAVTHWYDTVYVPVVEVIRAQHILEDFPGRTETDVYLWISEHRAISRKVDATHTDVFLTEIWTRLNIFPYIHLDELIIKMEYIAFQIKTRMHELRPKTDLTVSSPGKYPVFEEHIDVHRYFMGIEQKREIPYQEAVEHWYDTVYVPVLNVIVEQHLLRDFPDLTAADLYLWICEYRSTLEKRAGHQISIETAASELAERFGSRKSAPFLSRVGKKLLDTIAPEQNESPARLALRHRIEHAEQRSEHLFVDMLVPINGQKNGWHVLDQAIEIARREDGHISGLHVVTSEHLLETEAVQELKTKFEQRCQAADVEGELTFAVGEIVSTICDYSRWTDLLVLHLLHPPGAERHALLQPEFRTLNRQCASPILALPESVTPINNILLAYDGSQKAHEALFVSAYLAGCWDVSLTVLTEKLDSYTRSFIKSYLKRRGIDAPIVQQRGEFSGSLAKTAQEHQSDLILIGGYGEHPIMEFIFGRPVDRILKTIQRPILICR